MILIDSKIYILHICVDLRQGIKCECSFPFAFTANEFLYFAHFLVIIRNKDCVTHLHCISLCFQKMISSFRHRHSMLIY